MLHYGSLIDFFVISFTRHLLGWVVTFTTKITQFQHSHKKKTLVRKRTIPHCSELIVLVFTRVQTSECSKTNFDLAWNGWKETDFSHFLGYFGWNGKGFLSKISEKGVTHPWKSTCKRKLTGVGNFAQKTTIKTLRNISK